MTPEVTELAIEVLGEVDAPPRSLAQARRRAERAVEQLRSVLRSQGYYAFEISAEFASYSSPEANQTAKSISSDKKRTESALDLTPILKVKSGPQFTFSDVTIEFVAPDIETPNTNTSGTNASNIGTTEASAAPPYPAPDINLTPLLQLPKGDPARSANVVATELRLINALKAKGYPEAVAQTRNAVVDHATATLSVTYRLSSGQKTEFGEIVRTGNSYIRKGWPAMVAPFKSGETFSDIKMNRLTSRVIGTGVFDSVTAVLADEGTQNPDGTITRNVLLNIEQDAKNTISGELGYSTSDGSGLSLSYERRNYVGYAQTLTLNSNLKTNLIDFGAVYNIPFMARVDRELNFSAEVARENSESFRGERLTAEGQITQKISRKFKISAGLELEASQFKEEIDGQDKTRAYLTQVQALATYDSRNNLLNPVKGVLAEAKVLPTYNFGDVPGLFTIFEASGSHYRSVADQVVLAGRLKYGSIVGAGIDSVPLNRRFYGGGGGSVRGYAFQSISPENADGDVIGGRSILEGSAEVRYRAPDTVLDGNLGIVGFVDAATVSRLDYPDFDGVLACAGVGVRYYTSFAPIRADIAIPLNKREDDAAFQIYLSIGQSF